MFGNKTIRLHDEETERLSEQCLVEIYILKYLNQYLFFLKLKTPPPWSMGKHKTGNSSKIKALRIIPGSSHMELTDSMFHKLKYQNIWRPGSFQNSVEKIKTIKKRASKGSSI